MQQKPHQQPAPDSRPLSQKIEIAAGWARLPALTLMVFLRRDIGYRMVSPLWLGGVVLLVMLIAGNGDEANRPDDLLIFALAALTLGLYQRYNRWQDFRRGIRHHTYYIGTSIFERLRFADFLRRDRRIARYVDPFVCGIIGALLLPFTSILARWIIFAAACLFALEHFVHHKEFHRDLDMLDGMANSEMQGDVVDYFSPPPNRHAEDSAGIPTGLGADTNERIKKRGSSVPSSGKTIP
jgi:hypothetical protein